jgi:acylphosphatase
VSGPPVTDRPATSMRLTAWVHGRVQGVGMRWWIRARALEGGLVGWARNLDDGRVEVVAEGPEPACRTLLAGLREPGPPGRVDLVVERWSPALGVGDGFVAR